MDSNFKHRYGLSLVAAALLAVATSLAAADNAIETHNDGTVVSAYAVSSKQVVSMFIRVVGPNDYLYEERIEADEIHWIPEANLPDGTYHWEARVVTVSPDAPVREEDDMRPAVTLTEGSGHGNAPQGDDVEPHEPIRLEHYFHAKDRQVKTATGTVTLDNGWLEDVSEQDGFSHLHEHQPTVLERLMGRLLDTLVPSAHAETFTTDIVIDKTDPTIFHETGFGNNTIWRVRGFSGAYFVSFTDDTQGYTVPFWINKDSPEDSLRIRGGSQPRVGIGTSGPTQGLHISRANASIRLEDTSSNSSWYVRNTNQSRFNLTQDPAHIGPFWIEDETPNSALAVTFRQNCIPGIACGSKNPSIGIGNDSPLANIDIQARNHMPFPLTPTRATIRLRDASGGTTQLSGGGTGFAVESFFAASDGNVGIGTFEPQSQLHLQRDDGTARIDVVDTEESASFQIMYALTNAGNTQFRMENTATDKVWNFRTQDFGDCSTSNTCFVINKRSGPRFRFMEDGDMFIEGAYENSSSKTVKHGIADLNPEDLFERLGQIGVYEWSYDHSPDTRHIGPMAEDFYAAFGLGSGERSISPSNMAGISLAAAQALHERNQELEQRLEKLEALLMERLQTAAR